MFTRGGWLFFLWLALKGFREYWLEHIQHLYEHHRHFVLLAVNIPRMNEQSPKAVEQIFSQLHGALSGPNFVEKYWLGKTQERFSFEIVSLGGYIQFFVRTNVVFRDLVEAAFFAQYPDAEIVESPDYMDRFPAQFPDPEWRMWGAEFGLTKEAAYPIRTYVSFEHTLSQDFKDPVSGLLESLSRLAPDENAMIQYVASPVNDSHWKENSQHVVDFIAGAPAHHSDPLWAKILRFPVEAFEQVVTFMLPKGEDHGGHAPAAEEPLSQMQYLTPGEKVVLEGVQMKMAKIGYEVKIRALYIAKHAAYSKVHGVPPMLGAFRQFSTQDMNAIKPIKQSDVDYFKWRVPARQRSIMKAFRTRHPEMGAGEGKILNIEELATVFHFPAVTVKAPLVKKTEYKRAEPPFSLPVSQGYTAERAPVPPAASDHGAAHGSSHGAPDNLPTH